MSIFKQTFRPFLCRQIKARQDLLAYGLNRPIEVQQYTTAKSPWIRASSFVNYSGSGYVGTQLAQKYVLSAGTLLPDPTDNTSFSLRYGVGTQNSAYGGLGDGNYGLVPMPGISSVEVKSKGAYGSLKETTVKFYAWNKKQLDELEILFMRPGYTVLVEWGWSMYIDTYANDYNQPTDPGHLAPQNKIDIGPKLANHSLVKSFTSPTINPFLDNLAQDKIYDQIHFLQHKFSGNYDACLGKIVNFSWKLLPNGGFECTTVLISIGDILDALKINTSTGDAFSVTDQNKKDYKDEFGQLMAKIASKETDDSEISAINQLALAIPGVDILCRTVNFTVTDPTTGKFTQPWVNYIQLGYFIHILNERFNLYSDKQKYINIEIPVYSATNKGNGLCIASKGSLSIDPTVCTIKNTAWSSLFNNIIGFDLFAAENKLKDPSVQLNQGVDDLQVKNNTGIGIQDKNSSSVNSNDNSFVFIDRRNLDVPAQEFLYNNSSLGVIGNIYVSIDKIMQIYDDLSKNNDGQVHLYKLIKNILDQCSYALGSINDFDIFVDDNTAVIIDKHYTEISSDTVVDSKYQVNVIGNNSAVREADIHSKIFESQTNLIAIAAQDTSNVANVQSSTNVFLNAGLTNRLAERITEFTRDGQDDASLERQNIIVNNILPLIDYVQNQILQFKIPDSSIISSMNNYLNTLILKVNHDADNRAIIPFVTELTFDGIGGFTQGEIFRLNTDVLPSDYFKKNFGLVVYGIDQTITRSDWKTKLSAYIALLNQGQFQYDVLENLNAQIQSATGPLIQNAQKTSAHNVAVYNGILYFLQKYFANNISVLINVNYQILGYYPGNLTNINVKSYIDNTNDPNVVSFIANINGNLSAQQRYSFLNVGDYYNSLNLFNGSYKKLTSVQNGAITNSDFQIFILNPFINDTHPVSGTNRSGIFTAAANIVTNSPSYISLPSDLQQKIQDVITNVDQKGVFLASSLLSADISQSGQITNYNYGTFPVRIVLLPLKSK